MNIGYIKQKEMPISIIDKIKYFNSMVFIVKFEEGYSFEIPIFKKEKNLDKVVKNINKQIEKKNINMVVISDDLNSTNFYSVIKEKLVKLNTNVLNGKKLMTYMSYNILEYIFKLHNTQMEKEDIFFLIKKEEYLDLQFILRFVKNCKTVNIITNDIVKFKNIQNKLYEEENILIGVSNNKNKSLKRAKYIINVNMNKKDLDKFKINRDAIIINLKENIKYSAKAFEGININYIDIYLPDEHIEKFEIIGNLEKFDKVKLYESILLKKIEKESKKNIMKSREDAKKQKNIVDNIMLKDGIKIIGLIGNNGKVDENEIIRKYQKVI